MNSMILIYSDKLVGDFINFFNKYS